MIVFCAFFERKRRRCGFISVSNILVEKITNRRFRNNVCERSDICFPQRGKFVLGVSVRAWHASRLFFSVALAYERAESDRDGVNERRCMLVRKREPASARCTRPAASFVAGRPLGTVDLNVRFVVSRA